MSCARETTVVPVVLQRSTTGVLVRFVMSVIPTIDLSPRFTRIGLMVRSMRIAELMPSCRAPR